MNSKCDTNNSGRKTVTERPFRASGTFFFSRCSMFAISSYLCCHDWPLFFFLYIFLSTQINRIHHRYKLEWYEEHYHTMWLFFNRASPLYWNHMFKGSASASLSFSGHSCVSAINITIAKRKQGKFKNSRM